MEEKTWEAESKARLDSLMVAYYLAIRGMPIVGAKIKLPHDKKAVVFPNKASIDQAKMEISNAFFLRLKGLVESQLKQWPNVNIDWRDETSFLKSLCLEPDAFDKGEKRLFSQFCKLRNVLAHDYGRVNDKTKEKLTELKDVSHIAMDETTMKNWFIFADRVFRLVGPKRLPLNS
jgi:hypothetical protein